VQPLRHLLHIALAIERQQSGQNVADGIGSAVAPGQLLAGLDDPVVAQLGLEGAGFSGGGEEKIAARYALVHIGEQGVDVVTVVGAFPGGGDSMAEPRSTIRLRAAEEGNQLRLLVVSRGLSLASSSSSPRSWRIWAEVAVGPLCCDATKRGRPLGCAIL
jgi:hypothetical protein